ncbi:bifunctional transcriptional activator/DNA repair enzyme AdaA [Paenibacillus polysaccharolyticus]|uniref:bifunctional transcriptional activator/DNA repair enzyme AdaA n=1 Tax=Paenibacillus polysaccharolyticus TaxID=582692 RepID=UPI0030087398
MKPTEQHNTLPSWIPHEYWEAIIQNDHTYDGTFFYAVQTTGIFCRPSCRSRAPKSDNVLIFQNAEQALAHNFRPCKRCKPTGERVPDQEWIYGVTEYIAKHYTEPLTLDVLAVASHGSPYHLHRVFKRITGQTPVQYIQAKRISEAQALLEHTHLTVNEIARQVGISNPAYFISVFRKLAGCTPAHYRERHDSS